MWFKSPALFLEEKMKAWKVWKPCSNFGSWRWFSPIAKRVSGMAKVIGLAAISSRI